MSKQPVFLLDKRVYLRPHPVGMLSVARSAEGPNDYNAFALKPFYQRDCVVVGGAVIAPVRENNGVGIADMRVGYVSDVVGSYIIGNGFGYRPRKQKCVAGYGGKNYRYGFHGSP